MGQIRQLTKPLLFLLSTLSLSLTAHADQRLEIKTAKVERMFAGTTAFIDNSTSTSKIVECDAQGNVVWEFEIPARLQSKPRFASDLEWIPSRDSFLFTSRGNGIFEVERNKNIIWSYATEKVSHDADRLANGNTLFTWGGDTDDAVQVTEINPQGEIVWQWKAKPQLANDQRYENVAGRNEPYSYTHTNAVTRLPSGNTLISLRNFHMVVEVDAKGSIVRRHTGLAKVHDPFLLPNGNLLAALLLPPNYFPIREIGPAGETVWEFAEQGLIGTTVERLPNGNYSFAGRAKIVEVTPDKEVVWRALLPGVDPSPSNQQQHLYKVVRIPRQPVSDKNR